MILHNGIGQLRNRETSLVLEIDQGIVDFYYSLIPKYYYAKRQKYRAHITVIRSFEKRTLTGPKKGSYSFLYNPYVFYEKNYFFLNCYSDELSNIREQWGLSRLRPGTKCFHITIGNIKEN